MARLPCIALLAFALSACSSQPATRSMSGETLSVELLNRTSAQRVVSLYLDDYDCYGFNTVKFSPSASGGQMAVVERRPFQTVTFQYLGVEHSGRGLASTSCAGTYSFATGDASAIRIITGESKEGCGIRIEARGRDTPAWWSVELIERKNSQPALDGSGPWCEADARFRGSSSLVVPR